MSNRTITSPRGFRAAGVACGIKQSGNPDLGLLICDGLGSAAGCFTRNKVFAAPIAVCRKHISSGYAKGLVVNSGNANACTGERGMADALTMTKMLAEEVALSEEEILVASTGVIGKPMDMEKIHLGISDAFTQLGRDEQSGMNFSDAILTTDLRRKIAYREFEADGRRVKIAGVAKGSGMISPNMATMLAFITTDAKLAPSDLQKHLSVAVEQSFNRITVDGEMSTNDSVFLLASGLACDKELDSDLQKVFAKHLLDLCSELAIDIVKDGEGATKIFHVTVSNASASAQAKRIARAVANSLLVKTAIHGGDPNWGRIISAAGASGVDFDYEKVTCSIGDEIVFKNGVGVESEAEKLGGIISKNDIFITLDLGEGEVSETIHSCDLSKDYIEINAFYHT